jgi:hypothetical protein
VEQPSAVGHLALAKQLRSLALTGKVLAVLVAARHMKLETRQPSAPLCETKFCSVKHEYENTPTSFESLEHLVALQGIGGSNVKRETVFRPRANRQLPIANCDFNVKRKT